MLKERRPRNILASAATKETAFYGVAESAGNRKTLWRKPHPRLRVKNASLSQSLLLTVATLARGKHPVDTKAQGVPPRPLRPFVNGSCALWAVSLNGIIERRLIWAFGSLLYHVLSLLRWSHRFFDSPSRPERQC